VNEFIEYLYTPLGTTSNYSVIANLHTLQINIAPAWHFSSLLCLLSRSLAVALTVEILHLHEFSFYLGSLSCRNQLSTDNYQLNYSTIFSQPPLQSSTEWVRATVRVRLRLVVYRQSVLFGAKPLKTHDQCFLLPTEQ
jgi:hypothetical protein